MPCYDYECSECKLTKEIHHSISESPEVKCDECNIVMKRLISGGSGFYGFLTGGKSNVQRERELIRKEAAQERHNIMTGKHSCLDVVN